MNIFLVCQQVCHIHNQSCGYKILKTSAVRIGQDQVAQITCCGTGLEQGIAAACYVWRDNIQFHIKFVFYDSSKGNQRGCTKSAQLEHLLVVFQIESLRQENRLC